MDKKTLRKRELLTSLLKKHGFYEGDNVRMTKREMLKLLRKSFDSNSRVYDRYEESWAIDFAVNNSWDIYHGK